MQCTATVYKTQQQCKRRAVQGRTVCQVHGGVTPRGIASPHYKTGRYSKVVPARFSDRYEAARRDTTLLELREEISLIDARLGDLLNRVDSGETSDVWGDLVDARSELLAARRAGNAIAQSAAINSILELIQRGGTDYEAWDAIGSTLEQRRRLVESERKRLVEMQQMVSTQQAMTLVQALLESVKRNVGDRDTISAIQADFIRLTTRNDSTIVDVG